MASALIGRVDCWLAANRPDYYARLQPGLTDAALNACESQFALRLPASFRAFYLWRNGQEAAYSASLQGNRMFSSLQEVVAAKDILDGMIGSDFEDPRWWRRGWIPFLSNGGGDHLCLDIAGEYGGTPGCLVAFWHDWAGRVPELRCVAAGVGGFDGGRRLGAGLSAERAEPL